MNEVIFLFKAISDRGNPGIWERMRPPGYLVGMNSIGQRFQEPWSDDRWSINGRFGNDFGKSWSLGTNMADSPVGVCVFLAVTIFDESLIVGRGSGREPRETRRERKKMKMKKKNSKKKQP